MKKVFIVHGFNGRPNGGWRPWLMAELAKKNIYACTLPMPSPDKPIVKEWVKIISKIVDKPNKEIFLIGHSLGVPAILRYLETLKKNQKIGGVVLVSGPLNPINENCHKYVNKFLEKSFDFKHIKNVCKNFVVIHGNNDKLFLFSNAELLSKKLSCKLIIIPNGGHLMGQEGWHKLPKLLKAIEKII